MFDVMVKARLLQSANATEWRCSTYGFLSLPTFANSIISIHCVSYQTYTKDKAVNYLSFTVSLPFTVLTVSCKHRYTYTCYNLHQLKLLTPLTCFSISTIVYFIRFVVVRCCLAHHLLAQSRLTIYIFN